MPPLTREIVLERAYAELSKLPTEDALEPKLAKRRERLQVLIFHLTTGVMSPSVLEAIAMRIREI